MDRLHRIRDAALWGIRSGGSGVKGVHAMLILTRRVGETLMIGEQVTVTVLGVKGNQVRVGISAPKDVSVHREEIFQRIQRTDAEETLLIEARVD